MRYPTVGMKKYTDLPSFTVIFFAQVNITNPTSRLVKFYVLSCYIHIQVNITKPKFSKWRLAVLWKLLMKKKAKLK
jgi:hypothetical protein